jgi:magnesium chelatase subunit D
VEYPFVALVGQEPLRTALLLNAVSPAVGGALVRGEKGTAKSTAARGLVELLPPLRAVAGCPFNCDPEAPWAECPHCAGAAEHRAAETAVPLVDLPLGATEDRVLGTLDFERALREGRRSFQPGLLARAHRGILYVDEVNLLPDHLVDVLLDAASSGWNVVQREGVALAHPARFLLVGTMNPEEGELRPQLLDRFGLMVEVAGPREPELRAEVVRRRLAFEADPAGFRSRWASEQEALRRQIAAGRAHLPQVVLDDGLLTIITRLCCEFEVDGLRADITLHKAACARAAFEGRTQVALEDVRAAAELVLPHRRRRRPFEQPQLDRERLDECLRSPPLPQARSASEGNSRGAGGEGRGEEEGGPGEEVFEPAPPRGVRRVEVEADGPACASRGRRNPVPSGARGAYVRAVPDPSPTSLALDATVRAAAARGACVDGRVCVERQDLHRKERAGRTGTLILFAVDASGSMAARRRMELVKSAVLGLLQSAYEQRDEVGVLAFRGPEAEMLLPPTASVELAERALRVLPTGGRTPLAHALVLAGEALRRARDGLPALLVLLSDGRANVCLPGTSGDPWEQALRAAGELAAAGRPALVLDTDASFVRLGRAEELARALAAECLPLEGLSAEELVLNVRRGKG